MEHAGQLQVSVQLRKPAIILCKMLIVCFHYCLEMTVSSSCFYLGTLDPMLGVTHVVVIEVVYYTPFSTKILL